MILYSFIAACTAFFLIEVLRWHKILTIPGGWVFSGDGFKRGRRAILDRKPFSCTVCLSGWLGLLFGLIMGYGWLSLFMLPVAAVFGLILDNATKRYL